MVLCGLMGRARSGKSTAAAIIDHEFGFIEISFAEALKDACRMIYGFSLERMEDGKLKTEKDLYWGLTPRETLQTFGSKLRELDQDIWIKAAMQRGVARYRKTNIEAAHARTPEAGVRGLVFPDTRYKNEAKMIKDSGGYLIRIVRPDLPDADAEWRKHQSETDLDNYVHDYCIESMTFEKNPELRKAFQTQVRKVMFDIIKKQESKSTTLSN